MTSAVQHYRLSMLGQDLKETLEELINAELFDAELVDSVWEHFDRNISEALANEVKAKAVIRGGIKHYRNHDDIWTIFLKRIELRSEGKSIESDSNTEMIAVSTTNKSSKDTKDTKR